MSQTKVKKSSQWVQCEKCLIFITSKDTDRHAEDCPLTHQSYGFIKNGVLCGHLETKTNEDIKGVVDRDSLVFLSQGAIQLCSLSIGAWCLITLKTLPPIAKVVWPTTEKSLTTVLLTKQALQLSSAETNTDVEVSAIHEQISEAYRVFVTILNASKTFEATAELTNRIQKCNSEKLFCEGNRFAVLFFGKLLKFEIKVIEKLPNTLENELDTLHIAEHVFYKATNKTIWSIYSDAIDLSHLATSNISKIGGLDYEINEIRDAINCLFAKDRNYGLRPSRSVLLYGNSGTGKTLLAKAVSKESKAHIVEICALELYNNGNIEETIKDLFAEAQKYAPAIVLLDEVDILCPIRSQRISELDKRISSVLLTMLDNLSEDIFILGTTNKIDSIDPMFRRHGRFDREIEISTPTPKSRKQILLMLLNNVKHNLTDEHFSEISLNTHGYVGADLVSLCSRASLHASKQNNEKITIEDFKSALKFVRPSAMREVQVEVANVKWSDIGGQNHLKLILKQSVEWPLRHPESFTRLGVTPPKGVLMFGPPGCSKTMIAKALATESGLNFLSIKGPELFSKWVGESEKAVRDVFRKARQVAPSVIFFDEIDAFGGERGAGSSTSVQERVLAQLLTELDGVSPLGDVTVLAATNRPDRIDKALLRPGRLDRIVYVPLPDVDTRREIFKLKMQKMPVSDVDIEELVALTEKYSGAEVNAVCHEAAMMALEENLNATVVEKRHFEKALQLVVPRTPDSLISVYQTYLKENR